MPPADEVCRILANQDTPNGVAWHNGSLYVMETTRLTRYDGIDAAVLNGCNVSWAVVCSVQGGIRLITHRDCMPWPNWRSPC